MSDLLVAENVSKKYANHLALDEVSLKVPQSSIFGLLGPNGAGKTSLLSIINQITAPDSGKVLFNGEPIRPEHVQEIGYLPEERGLYKKMKVGEQCVYLAQLKGMHRNEAVKRLKAWFEKFELANWWNKKVEELSKGMAQKVQFISTILHQPRLLILDEPFSGFDPINTNLIKSEILNLRKAGTTVIFSTHNMGSVEEICDHIVLLNKSKVILEGPVRDIRQNFRSNTFIVEFKGHSTSFTNALWTGFELLDSTTEDGIVKATVKTLNNNTPNQLLAAILPQVEVISFNEVLPTMNDIFITTVTAMSDAHTGTTGSGSNTATA